jgi:hypothetical protein
MLNSIIDDQGDLYLDELQQELFELGGGWWNPSTISRKLKEELKYSLQVATDILQVKRMQQNKQNSLKQFDRDLRIQINLYSSMNCRKTRMQQEEEEDHVQFIVKEVMVNDIVLR